MNANDPAGGEQTRHPGGYRRPHGAINSNGRSSRVRLAFHLAKRSWLHIDLEALFDEAIAEKRVWNLHGVVIVRKGSLVLERYFECDDDARGCPLGTIAFNADTLHDLRSVSKSVVGLLYGIALADGKVPPPDAPLFASFPEYADLAADPARNRWTIYNVLTMTMGTDWDELNVPYSDPTNTEIAMDMAPDRCRFVLGAPVVMQPALDLQRRRDRVVGANHCERHRETFT